MSDTVDALLAQKREETLDSFLSLLAGDDGTSRAAIARMISNGAGLEGPEYIVPPESLEEMLRMFRLSSSAAAAPQRGTSSGDDPTTFDDLEEIALPDSSAVCTSLLTVMLGNQRGRDAGSGDRWHAAAKAVVFDNFVDVDDGDKDAVGVSTAPGSLPVYPPPLSAGGAAPLEVRQGSLLPLPGVSDSAHRTGNTTAELPLSSHTPPEAHSGTAGGDEDEEDSDLDLPGATAVPAEFCLYGVNTQRQTESVQVELRAIVASCENTTAPFSLDPEFDYDANILGVSRRI